MWCEGEDADSHLFDGAEGGNEFEELVFSTRVGEVTEEETAGATDGLDGVVRRWRSIFCFSDGRDLSVEQMRDPVKERRRMCEKTHLLDRGYVLWRLIWCYTRVFTRLCRMPPHPLQVRKLRRLLRLFVHLHLDILLRCLLFFLRLNRQRRSRR